MLEPAIQVPPRGLTARPAALVFARQIMATPLSALGTILVLGLVIIAIAAPVIAPHDPLAIATADRLKPPSVAHWFGTDQSGRDVFSRVLYGARLSLSSALAIVAVAATIGTLVGLLAGHVGGLVDEFLMRLTDVFLAFPALILAMAINTALGPSLVNAIIATALVWWPWFARLVRGQTLALKHEAFIEAAWVAGAGNWRVVFGHILPNARTPIVVEFALSMGYAVLTMASLSFIGLGAQIPAPEWGSMVAIGRDFYLTQWWLVTFPGLGILIAAVAFNLFGDGVRDALSPGQRQ